jgi:hypothetical protein
MKRIKHAGLNGLLAAAAITLAGCVPPGANTSAATAALEHCSDFHYPQPPGVEAPMKAIISPVAYDQFGPRVWSTGTGAHRLECGCIQNMNFANSSKEFLRGVVNTSMASAGVKIDPGDNISIIDKNALYEFQGTSTKPEYRNTIVLGRMIGAGSCLFVAYSFDLPNTNDQYFRPEWTWLRSINYVKKSEQTQSSSSSELSDRLKTLDELRDQHRISDDEYRLQRARVLNGI